MRLSELVGSYERRLVVPLMGYPGARLTNSTLKQNGFNSELHYRSIEALVERFEPDAIFFMMDLSIEAGAVGLPIRYPLNESASVESHPVRGVGDLEAFSVLDPLQDARLRSYLDTMGRMRDGLSVLRGAYVIGPFTLAGLMMGAEEVAVATIENPDLVTAAVEFAENLISAYARLLVGAGAQLVAILEPTATFLSPRSFANFSGKYVGRIAAGLDVPVVLHICGNTTHLVPAMCATGVDGLSLDGPVNFPAIAPNVPPEVVLIGNVDPVRVMVAESPDGVRKAVRGLLDAMAPYPNFMLSTGCDLPLETPLENIEAFVAEGKAWRR